MGVNRDVRQTARTQEVGPVAGIWIQFLVSGIAVMTLAIANHEKAKAKSPEAFGDEDDQPPRSPGFALQSLSPCAANTSQTADSSPPGPCPEPEFELP